MSIRVILGSVLIALTMMITAFVMVNEPARMADFDAGYKGRSIEAGATLFQTACIGCHGVQGQGIDNIAPALNAADLLDDTKGTPARLKEIGWSGSLPDYLRAAIAGGRPRASASFANYPQRMPTWSQEFGGPMRPDQVENLVDFVMNWKEGAIAAAAAVPTVSIDAVGTDIKVELPEGDAANGELLFGGKVNGKFPCSACHSLQAGQTLVGPSLAGIATTAATRKDGYSAEQYIHESVVQPNTYIVEGFVNPSIMPATFGAQMTKEELADIIAYLMTLK
ncbi:MAG: c-type cytochrome [Chloroflexi bacterium]|nr:c-type cytochrome [Chloroflexota bacterium]